MADGVVGVDLPPDGIDRHDPHGDALDERCGEMSTEAQPGLKRVAPESRSSWRRIPGLPAPRRGGHFLIFKLIPEAANANFKPWVVDRMFMTTPFWFCMAVAEPPPAIVIPAVAAV